MSNSEINFNSGVVNISCLINSYCPIFKTYYTETVLPFSSESLKNAPDGIKDMFSTVPGLNGIFMKPLFLPYHNFLVWRKENSESSGDNGGSNQGSGDDSEDSGNESEKKTSENLDDSLIDLYEFYDGTEEERGQFSWETTWSLFADRKDEKQFPLRFSEYNVSEDERTIQTDSDQPIYSYKPVKIDQSSASSREGMFSSGEITFISQVAASCESTGSVHWGLQKTEKLFRGEDFYIEFRKITLENDVVNKDSSKSMNDKYQGIDVNISPVIENLPPNLALVSYEYSPENNYFLKNSDSSKYNLNNQPYLVIMISPESSKIDSSDSWYYAIIIPYNAEPIFVKYYQVKYTSPSGGSKDSWTTNSLGSYNVSGSSLLNQNTLRVSLRNHLGNIVVTFSGHEDNPWIISESPPEVSKNVIKNDISFTDLKKPPPIALVPEGYLQIYGGNYQTSFMFAPIQYDQSGSALELPITRKNETVSEKLNPPEPFVFPSDAQMKIKLSVKSEGIDPSALYTNSGDYINNPFFTGDYQSISGTDDGDVDTFYMDLKDWLKDNKDKSASPSLVTVDRSYIKNAGSEYAGCDVFTINISMFAGDHNFSNGYQLLSCKTPVINILRLEPSHNEPDAWPTDGFDAGLNVLSITDNWSSSDFHKMDHNATITFLISSGITGKPKINNKSSKASSLSSSQIAEKLKGLADKAFYINVKAGYVGCNYSKLEGLHNIITGLCHGGQITEKAGITTMQCKIEDYSVILQNSLIFNSPFYDGVRDVNAVQDLLRYAKLKSDGPSSLISSIVEQTNESNDGWSIITESDESRSSHGRIYALSQSYARLTSGSDWRFSDGEKIYDALYKIAKKSGKVMFFDASGVFHYESFPIDYVIYGSDNPNMLNPNQITPMYSFTSSPYGTGQLIFNQLSTEIAVSDVYNNLLVISSTPKGELIVANDVENRSLYDPSFFGFLGYNKVFYQQEGLFGSELAVKNYLKLLKKFNRPPIVFKFETFGLPLRCFDIVSVDEQRLILTNISSTIDAAENKWWSNLEGEWFNGYTRQIPNP